MSGDGEQAELQSSAQGRSHPFASIFAPLWISVPIVWYFASKVGLNHDAALFLYCGQMILAGEMPYVDFVEINPPMVMYLSILPALFPKLVLGSVQVSYSFVLLVGALFGYSQWGIMKSLRDYHGDLSLMFRWLFVGSWLGFSLLLFYTPEVLFAQREHLFLMFYVPYFFLRVGRYEGASISPMNAIAFGVVAAIGVCLKPHFVAIALCVELYSAGSRKTIRPFASPEFLGFAGLGLAYAGHFLFLPSPMGEALFDRWIPLIARGYGAYNVPQPEDLFKPSIFATLVLTVYLPLAVARKKFSGYRFVGPLAAFTAGSLTMYFVEHKGWPYHLNPVWLGSVFLGVLATASFLEWRFPRLLSFDAEGGKLSPAQFALANIGFGLFVVGAMGLVVVNRPGPLENPLSLVLTRLNFEGGSAEEYVVPDEIPSLFGPPVVREPVLIISTSVAEVFPRVVDLDLEIASRYLWTFPIALLYADAPDHPEGFPYHAMDESPPEELQFLQELGDDIVNNAPKVIVIDYAGQAQGCPVGFNPADYLRVNGFVGRYMTNYKEPRDIMGKKVYYRKDIVG